MSDVIVIKGAVTYSITLDPSVWIFDERKIDFQDLSMIDEDNDTIEQHVYLQGAGSHWDRELREGATPPTERPSMPELRKSLEGDFGMKLSFFLKNAQVSSEATILRVHRENGETVDFSLEDANRAILQFAQNGKPIREKGPVFFYLPEQLKNHAQPIDSVVAFELI
ncbi:hypothetical protein ACQCN2_16715 [Brevibacillus ginsengisoli]|uniref:hypothetical protein n=1 Tax=Brevibacillus ginsengisoli TaxID=363854 RepID=UPI003CF1F567